jgi:hypothetical protein
MFPHRPRLRIFIISLSPRIRTILNPHLIYQHRLFLIPIAFPIVRTIRPIPYPQSTFNHLTCQCPR